MAVTLSCLIGELNAATFMSVRAYFYIYVYARALGDVIICGV